MFVVDTCIPPKPDAVNGVSVGFLTITTRLPSLEFKHILRNTPHTVLPFISQVLPEHRFDILAQTLVLFEEELV